MRARTHLLRAGALAILAAVAAPGACGRTPEVESSADEQHAAPDASTDARSPRDAAAEQVVIDAPFGLDERPANPTCRAPARPAGGAVVGLTRVFPSLTFTSPVALVQAPGDASRFYALEQGGRVRVFANDPAATTSSVAIDLGSEVNATQGESGLLGVAFAPDFATSGHVYLSYTAHGGPVDLSSVVRRYTSHDGGSTFDPASEVTIFGPLVQPYTNHNGGWIAFGPDGFLYLGLGDGGSAGDPSRNGQNVDSLFGKMLRIDPRGGTPYAIPSTNPFAHGGGKAEIYAWGLRNPWRFSFDRATGDLWAGDVGQNQWEEIDVLRLGGNYGWNTREGSRCYQPMTGCATAGLVEPVWSYDHGQGNSVTGGYVYRGSAIPSLVGTYVFGDFGSGRLWGLAPDAQGALQATLLNPGGPNPNISSFAEDVAGELYALDYASGGIFRIDDAGSPPTTTFPQTLSATGCVDPHDPTQPSAGLVPYAPTSSLWSDGADKERWVAIPDGEQIAVGADGDLDLPVGSVTMKTFSVGGRRVETRLFVRHDDGGWAGYSYAWNDAETDATLLPASATANVGGKSWYFPGRGECLQCHVAAAGGTLGLETGQLDAAFVYPDGRRANQLATWAHVGLVPAGAATSPVPPLVSPSDDGSPGEARARAYLHANCSFCHRPGGTGGGSMDLRWTTAPGAVGACDIDPQNGALGIDGAKLLAPGAPERSLVSVRMRALDARRMPPLASHVVDDEGAGVIDAWIRSIAACP